MAAQFDASQYGFFGGPSGEGEGVLLSELEGEGGDAASQATSDNSPFPPARPATGAEGGGGGGDTYHLWGGALLPDELDRLSLGEGAAGHHPAPNAGSAAAPGAQAAPAPGPPQQPGDLASLWGNAQGDRNDPFGSYLAGLRLGTGF
jgi:hypothetical protein